MAIRESKKESKKETKRDTKKQPKQETKFLKQELIKSNLYKSKKDLLVTLLCDDMMYSKSEVDKLIKKYMEGLI